MCLLKMSADVCVEGERQSAAVASCCFCVCAALEAPERHGA